MKKDSTMCELFIIKHFARALDSSSLDENENKSVSFDFK